ncbi:Cyclic AMP receptor-like protein A-like isoform X2 [Oopsacas minuta]|uniref:Cyclic AMP receptor-like protein A-like isoform X2 n=1 Tax=Oopsacas minuta TaxID=111878 RepID=A0AAV7JKC2_9METZ|nr:Cyclic AMP receptor-like protein A-like isoform X2 [Oopsacas minuta]
MNSTCIFTEEGYCIALEVIRRMIGTISVLSSIFILGLIFQFRRYEFTSQRLIMYLVTATLFDALAYAVGGSVIRTSVLCTIDGFYLSLADWGVVVWVCNITVNLFWNVVVLRPTNRYFEVFYICSGIVVPIFFGIFPFIDNSYGPAGQWCWILGTTTTGQILRFLTWYIPIWLIIPGLFIVFLVIIIKLSWEVRRWDPYNPASDRYRDLIRREIKPLILYPLVFLLLNVFPSINRIQNAIAPDNPIFTLYILHSFSSPLLGAGCTLIFVVNRDTLKELKWSNFRQTLLTRFNSRGKVMEFNAEGDVVERDHSVEISTPGSSPYTKF